MRLAKYLAHAGVASRRSAEELVKAGRVTVGEEVVTDPARDVQQDSRVAVDGRPLREFEPRVLYVVNKPVGVVSTARDTHGRPTVVELVPAPRLPAVRPERGVPFRVRLYPVGRLDADSSGLILLTNDGELADRLTHPRFEVPKTYRARVGGGPVGDDALSRLRRGVQLKDGLTAPAQVRRAGGDGRSRSTIELTIHEGRNRQVRRMCEEVGHPVLALERIAFGPLRLGDLAPGAHRRLSDEELQRLRAAVA
jgi:23S rRNA pseudouridine2605 synthase